MLSETVVCLGCRILKNSQGSDRDERKEAALCQASPPPFYLSFSAPQSLSLLGLY